MFDEDIDAADAADIEQQLATLLPEPKATKPPVAKRQPLPPELPREEVRLAPASDSCPDCGHTLRFIRDEISERLEYVPARFIVHRHVRPQFSCAHGETVVSEPLPAQLIEKGLPGPGLLAQVVCAKSLDHLPLYRQQVIYQRSGVDLPRSTLAGWFGAVGAALKPLAQARAKPNAVICGLISPRWGLTGQSCFMTANRGAVVSMPAMCLRAGAALWWWTVMLVIRRCSATARRLKRDVGRTPGASSSRCLLPTKPGGQGCAGYYP